MGSRVGAIKIAAGKIGLPVNEYLANISNGFKWCFKCRRWQPRYLFGMDSTRTDGLSAVCLQCKRVKIKKTPKIHTPNKKVAQRAVDAIRWAIKRGRLASPKNLPCINCGEPAHLYHHHLGYEQSHLLDVQAVCRKCHKKLHY